MFHSRRTGRLDKIYKISRAELHTLHKRAYYLQQHNHREACGVVAISGRNSLKLCFLKNRTYEPYRYLLHQNDLRRAYHLLVRRNLRILGTFHSHPISTANPSPGDIKKGFFKGIELIYDVCGREAKLWHLKHQHGELTVKLLTLILN